MSARPFISRRELLGLSGLIVSFAALRLPVASAQSPQQTQLPTAHKPVASDEVDGFLAIDRHGNICVFSGKVDLGTGVRTAITQIVAEELDVPIARVSVIEGDTLLTPDQGPTYGSLSIQNGGTQIRQAAATARRALIRQAARRLHLEESELTVETGVIKAAHGTRSVSYGDLIGGRTFALAIDKDAPLKDPATYTVVGRSQPRLDIPEGDRAVYLHARLPRGGNGARTCRAPPRHRRHAACSERGLGQTRSRHHQSCAAAQLPCRRRGDRMGCDHGGTATRGQVVGLAGSSG